MSRAEPTNEDLAAAVRHLRTERGLSIDEAASRSSMHNTYLSRIERNESSPTWEKICGLAIGLEVLPSDIARAAEAECERRTTRAGR